MEPRIFKAMNKQVTIFDDLLVGWLLGFNNILTIVGYVMPNPLYTYIKYIWFLDS